MDGLRSLESSSHASCPSSLCLSGARPRHDARRLLIAQVTLTRERQTSGHRSDASYRLPGGSTQGAFAAFLRDDDALFRRLGQSRIRYCSTSPDVARKARGLCYRRYQTTDLAMHPALTRPGDPVVRRAALLHFKARRRFESRASHTFSQGGSTNSVRTSGASQGTGWTRGISGGASTATRRSRPRAILVGAVQNLSNRMRRRAFAPRLSVIWRPRCGGLTVTSARH